MKQLDLPALPIVPHGANRFEVQGGGKRRAVFDRKEDAEFFCRADAQLSQARAGERRAWEGMARAGKDVDALLKEIAASRKCNMCPAEGKRYDLCADCATRFLPAAPAEWQEENQRLRIQMATADEQVGQAVALINQGLTDAALSLLYTWLRRGAK